MRSESLQFIFADSDKEHRSKHGKSHQSSKSSSRQAGANAERTFEQKTVMYVAEEWC